MKKYGINYQADIITDIEYHLEELKHRGFTVLEGVLSEDVLATTREKMDHVYQVQEDEFGKDNLVAIKELNTARCLLAYDSFFMDIALNERVIEIIKLMLGEYFILHLQNGIINKPSKHHHQSSWHRDLPYQDFIISKPLAVSAFFCIDNFIPETGSTILLPFSHKIDHLPSQKYLENHSYQVSAKPGSVIIFDAMVYHKGGYNSSNQIRRGINNVYVAPLLKQQINLTTALDGKYQNDPFLSKFLGYESGVKESVNEYRKKRLSKVNGLK